MNPEIKAELWRVAQAAFDAQGLASEDPAVLDLLVEHPELAPEMDQMLHLERQLQILQSAAPAAAGPQRLVLGFAALVAAVLLIAWAPSLWDQDTPEPIPDSVAGSSPEAGSLETELRDPVEPAPGPLIESYELAIVQHRPRGAKATKCQTEEPVSDPESEGSKPQIHSFTFSRTHSAPRGANTTY